MIASAVVYQLQISNSYDATVGERTVQIPMSLTGNGTLLLEGDYIKLIATVTDANGVGKVVTFKEGATVVGLFLGFDLSGQPSTKGLRASCCRFLLSRVLEFVMVFHFMLIEVIKFSRALSAMPLLLCEDNLSHLPNHQSEIPWYLCCLLDPLFYR